ncbi:hypothetical protein [Pedobacter alluvionis]|uniref:DoxX-like protein n=1 Tax=Pedobacter alluvionis TaxID=475253 RepID=A0A497XSP4_9SPHI|nr:hypothetical protein [Pedobacter alluvionis]RLJ72146.1 hypothetical protein BCL90_4988 [Pedobacter alluvionis]TFB28913.1 hypothetical protein E3V97_22625 [Pedobacter alluvionis]
MNVIRKIEHWADVHHSKWLDYLRIVLGLIIFGKGVSFISDTSAVQNMITPNNVFGFSGVRNQCSDSRCYRCTFGWRYFDHATLQSFFK